MAKSKKNTKRSNKTMKNRKHTKENMVKSFLEMLNAIKLYHWKTESYSQHKATDELHEHLSENVDEFVEVLLGKEQTKSKYRITMIEKHMKMMDSNDEADFIQKMHNYRYILIDMNNVLDKKKDSDLLNIRDEMLAHINQFLYLLSFDK